MARVSFSALIEEIVGKMAGSVFQDSYGGWQIRTRVTPRNPQTNYQQLRRGEFGYISGLWRTLTSVQRQTFIDAASTPPAALNLFITANVNLSLINEAIISTYVPSSDPGSMTIEFVDVTPSTMTIRATGGTTTVPAGTKLLVQVTYPKLPTRIFTNPSQYSPVLSFDEGTDLSVPVDIISEWQSRYGVLTADKRLCLKANLIDKSNGLRGADSINCTISTDMAVKYIPLFVTVAQNSNAGAGNVTLDTYTIAANTLINNGDKLLVRFSGVSNSTGGNNRVSPNFFGSGVIFGTFGSNSTWDIEVVLMRITSTTMSYEAKRTIGLNTFEFNAGSVTGIDYTTSNTVTLETNSPATSSIVERLGYCDLVRIP